MCGLFAFIGDREDVPVAGLRRGLEVLKPRGPDAVHEWSGGGAWFGHRRLAIIDLDPRAEQPLHSACGRYAIIFNGEIYNYRALRDFLAREHGVQFRTEGDTEVIVELYAREGAAMLSRLRGMFACVIWDKERREAFAARDPYGIKPLCIARCADGGVLLSSQVRACMATGLVSREPDARGQAGYWLLGSVPEPRTWFRDVQMLPAGHHVRVGADGTLEVKRWWDVASAWREGASSAGIDAAEAESLARRALRESVSAHLVADVPVGVFLSGGIDSGALAGLMTEAGARQLQGVTIAYREYAGSEADESPGAALLARHYGIQHHVRMVDRAEFQRDLPRVLACMDQPSIDGVNTWYASKAVAELGLKVIVSGVGGDELFQGYGHFRQLPRLVDTWRVARRVPGTRLALQALCNLQARRSGKNRWRHLPEWAGNMGGAWWLRRSLYAPDDLPALMGPDLAREALQGFSVDRWLQESTGALAPEEHSALAQIESTMYLRNQLLRDSDWASMDHSVELRTPLVDAWLVRELQPLLAGMKRFPNKSLLAGAPERPLPMELANRKKTGFGIPIGEWRGQVVGESWPVAVARAYTELHGA